MHKQSLLLPVIIGMLFLVPLAPTYASPSGGDTATNLSRAVLAPDSHDNIQFATSMTFIDSFKPAVDSDGNIWISGSYELVRGNDIGRDGFVTKLDPAGDILWTRYFDGSGDDSGAMNVNFDSEGNAYVAIQTTSRDLPVVNTEVNSSVSDFYRGSNEVYIEKLDPDGTTLWSTYFGGLGIERWVDLAIDEDDNLFVWGETQWPGIPLHNSWLNQEYDNHPDTFILKYTSDGQLLSSTIYGSANQQFAGTTGRVRSDGRLAIMGYNAANDLPNATPHHGDYDLFLMELNTTSQEILQISNYGGSSLDYGRDFIFDDADNLYFAGLSASADVNHTNPYDNTLNGSSDGYLIRVDSDRNTTWSTYFGGNNDEEFNGLYLDEDGNIVVMGITGSSNLLVTDNTTLQGSSDAFLVRFAANGSTVLQSTYLGTDGSEIRTWPSLLDGLMGMSSTGDDFYSKGQLVDKDLRTYPFDFGESEHTYLIDFDTDTFDVNRLITNVVVPAPDDDFDQDGLTNWEEYVLYRDQGILVDPTNPDSDNDGLPDGWEIQFGLDVDDPVESSADVDTFDGDGLTNLQEYQFSTWPNMTDTDGDGMDDKYEFDHSLSGDSDDAEVDNDGDQMPNGYEYAIGLSASDVEDGNEDLDGDNVVNSQEYLQGTDPTNPDSDGDGLDDGYELSHGMDPLVNDLDEDSDGDFLPNRLEYQLRLNPGNPIEGIVILGSVSTIVATFGYLNFRSKQRQKIAVSAGYENYKHQKKVEKAGFDSLEEYNSAKQNGFLHKKAESIIQNLGYETVGQYISGIDFISKEIDKMHSQEEIKSTISKIDTIKNPVELAQVRDELQPYLEKLSSNLQQTAEIIGAQEKLLQLPDVPLFSDISRESVLNSRDDFKMLRIRQKEYQNQLSQAFQAREDYLVPWTGILKLIQITEDNASISLADLAEVARISEDHAEELIQTLLEDHPEFGTYNPDTGLYTKSKQSILSSYLKEALDAMGEYNEEA